MYVAQRTIKIGEEITVDYGEQFTRGVKCLCKEDGCKGWISGPIETGVKDHTKSNTTCLNFF